MDSSLDLFGSTRSMNRLRSYFSTKLEKRLLASLVFFALTTITLLIAVIVVASRRQASSQANADLEDVCQTEACYNISNTIQSFIDTSIKPCEDFYEFTCGNWIKSYELPDTSLESGPTAFTQQKIDRQIRGKTMFAAIATFALDSFLMSVIDSFLGGESEPGKFNRYVCISVHQQEKESEYFCLSLSLSLCQLLLKLSTTLRHVQIQPKEESQLLCSRR